MSVTVAELREAFPAVAEELEEDALAHIAAALERLAVEAGREILTYKQPAHELFLLAKDARVAASLPLAEGELELGERGPGSWVGELGFIEEGPASATVRVTAPGELWRLSGSALTALRTSRGESDAVRRAKRAAAAALLGLFLDDLCQRLRESSLGVVKPDGEGEYHFEHVEGKRHPLSRFLTWLMGYGS